MKKIYTFILHALATSLVLPCFVSCGENDNPDNPDPGEKSKRKMTMLVYAIVSNLGPQFESDKSEMIKGAEDIDLDTHSLFVYQVYRSGQPSLLELKKDRDGNPEFQMVKVYDRDSYSTDPARISEVIDDVVTMNPAEEYGLIFWSHATGWKPNFSTHGDTRSSEEIVYLPSLASFGADLNLDGDNPTVTDYTDIDELAAAVPDNTFSFIWFDVCYMGGIETAYQFRNKCEYYVGLPTEDPGNGMPYHLTLKYLLRENPDCVEAAKTFFNYYESGMDSDWDLATIGVYHQPDIEPVADYCRAAYAGAETPSSYGLQNYSRLSGFPFYDFGQYTRRIADSNATAPDSKAFEEAMSKYVVYKGATKYDFRHQEISQENYSGVSCSLFNRDLNNKETEYYKTLDWYTRVYE